MIYNGIFSSLMQYASQIWGQNLDIAIKIEKLQNKAIRIINFEWNSEVSLLYHKNEILTFSDGIKLSNFIFAHNTIKGNLPNSLCNWLHFINKVYDNQNPNFVKVPKIRTVTSGSNSIKYKSAKIWNEIIESFPKIKFLQEHVSYCKSLLTEHYIQKYGNS